MHKITNNDPDNKQNVMHMYDFFVHNEDDDRIMWKNTKMIIIDEVSFLTTSLLIKGDRQMRLLKEIKTLFGKCHVVFSGDFHQLLPIGGKALFEEDTVQFGAINKALFLNISCL